jgi:hypothetical protein
LDYVVFTLLHQLPCLCLSLAHRHSKQSNTSYEVCVLLILDDDHVWGDGTQISCVLL